MKKILIIFLLLNVFTVFSFENFPHYEFDLTVQPEKGIIKGNIDILITWNREQSQKGNYIYLALLMNLQEKRNPKIFPLLEDNRPGGFTPAFAECSNIKINDSEAVNVFIPVNGKTFNNFNLEHLVLRIDVPPDMEIDSTFHLTFDYKVKLSCSLNMDDFYYKDKMYSRYSWLPLLCPPDIDFDTYLPFQLTFFTYNAKVEVTPGWELAAQSEYFAQKENIFHVSSSYPIVSFPLVFLKDHLVFRKQIPDREKTISVYYKKGMQGLARMYASIAESVLEYYEDKYFPLNYKYISILPGTPGGYGHASDGIVVLGDTSFKDYNLVMPGFIERVAHYVLAHELGHFYFGIGSPPDFATENYLSEGLNEYSTFAYFESIYGKWNNVYNSDNNDLISRLLIFLIEYNSTNSYRGSNQINIKNMKQAGWDIPMVTAVDEKIMNSQIVMDYQKSFVVLNMLSSYLGKDQFDSALTYYLKSNQYQLVSTDLFKKSLEEFYHKNTDVFFDKYIYGKESMDLIVKGDLNYTQSEKGYVSKITLDEKEKAEYIPVYISAYMANGEFNTVPVPGWGEFEIETKEKVLYVIVDRDINFLDYNRGNNVYPGQITPTWSDQYWLKQGEAVLFGIRPYLSAGIDTQTLGIGLDFFDRDSWSFFISPIIQMPLAYDSSIPIEEQFNIGGAMELGLKFPGHTGLSFSLLYTQPDIFESVSITLSKQFFFDNDLGYTAHYYYPNFSLSASTGISGLTGFDFTTGSLFQIFSCSLDFIPSHGNLINLDNRFLYHLTDDSFENRTTLSINQGFSFIPRTLLGFKLEGSAGFGELDSLSAGNQALGWASTLDEVKEYGFKAKSFFGFSLFNDIDYRIFNLIIFQSFNAGIVYEITSGFSDSAEITNTFQHAVGLEFFPVFKTMMDIRIPLGLGISFNLNAISKDPSEMDNYVPLFFIELDPLALFFSSTISY